MPPRGLGNAVKSFAEGYSLGRSLRRDWESNKVMREKPEEVQSDFSFQDDIDAPRSRAAIQASFESEPIDVSSAPAPGGAEQVSALRHRFMDQVQDTPFTRDQITDMRNERLADVEARFGDPQQALRMQASNEALTETRRVRAEAETKRKNLANLTATTQNIMVDMANGDNSSLQKFIEDVGGGSMPGYMRFDPKNNSLVMMTQSEDGEVGMQRLPWQHLLAYGQRAAENSKTGLVRDGLASLFDDVDKQADRQLSNANVRSQMEAREDQSARSWAGLQSQEDHRQRTSAIQAYRAANGSGRGGKGAAGLVNPMQMRDDDFLKSPYGNQAQREINAIRAQSEDKGGDLTAAQVVAAEQQIIDRARDRATLQFRVEDALSVDPPETVAADMRAQGLSDEDIATLFQLAGAQVPGWKKEDAPLAPPAEVPATAAQSAADPVVPPPSATSAPDPTALRALDRPRPGETPAEYRARLQREAEQMGRSVRRRRPQRERDEARFRSAVGR